ncbi:hypothetical protein CDAR_246241 [Caerostris darwini]|uniref:Uncharacterized protein n=1 Tax=Caerostris darwini TaxID=1538125 RepID=A0AAV4WBI2_9ARAC|nr:hypothetical protein CDAR_246241 [Caerostris darwini]
MTYYVDYVGPLSVRPCVTGYRLVVNVWTDLVGNNLAGSHLLPDLHEVSIFCETESLLGHVKTNGKSQTYGFNIMGLLPPIGKHEFITHINISFE